MIGGVLIALSALLALGISNLQGLLPGLPFDIIEVLFCAGAVVLAIGIGRAGSVTARRPLGTGAIIALAVWQLLVTPVLWQLFGADEHGIGAGDLSATMIISTTIDVVTLALALIAVVQVGRIGVVPKPWNWAPMWVLIAVAGPQLLLNLVLSTGVVGDQNVMLALFGLVALVRLTAIVFLGVLAIVLALRPAPTSTVVYSSGA